MFASCEIHFILDYLNEITVGGRPSVALYALYVLINPSVKPNGLPAPFSREPKYVSQGKFFLG